METLEDYKYNCRLCFKRDENKLIECVANTELNIIIQKLFGLVIRETDKILQMSRFKDNMIRNQKKFGMCQVVDSKNEGIESSTKTEYEPIVLAPMEQTIKSIQHHSSADDVCNGNCVKTSSENQESEQNMINTHTSPQIIQILLQDKKTKFQIKLKNYRGRYVAFNKFDKQSQLIIKNKLMQPMFRSLIYTTLRKLEPDNNTKDILKFIGIKSRSIKKR